MFYFNEPMPDCVPEFYRAQQEEREHQHELLMQRQEHYRANQEKINAAVASGLPILSFGGYAPCRECQTADRDTMTGDDDDLDCVICRDPVYMATARCWSATSTEGPEHEDV